MTMTICKKHNKQIKTEHQKFDVSGEGAREEPFLFYFFCQGGLSGENNETTNFQC